jgi:HEPN domain-containing protein
MSKPRRPNIGQFGESDYRAGALERFAEAYVLLRAERFAGSAYLAGRSVEGMLRAVLWKNDPEIRQGKKPLAAGHDLRNLLALVRDLGLLANDARDDEFQSEIERLGRLWFNNMRFASAKFVESKWRGLAVVGRRRTMKQVSEDFYLLTSVVMKRCEALCRRNNSKPS